MDNCYNFAIFRSGVLPPDRMSRRQNALINKDKEINQVNEARFLKNQEYDNRKNNLVNEAIGLSLNRINRLQQYDADIANARSDKAKKNLELKRRAYVTRSGTRLGNKMQNGISYIADKKANYNLRKDTQVSNLRKNKIKISLRNTR